jgi:hypothetical protein
MENVKTSVWNKPASEITLKESLILTGIATAVTVVAPVVVLAGFGLAEKINELIRNRKKPTLTDVQDPK